jgi:hypothetical protein
MRAEYNEPTAVGYAEEHGRLFRTVGDTRVEVAKVIETGHPNLLSKEFYREEDESAHFAWLDAIEIDEYDASEDDD